MKKQFTKIKIAAENLSRSNKTDCKDYELEIIEKQVDKYRDVLEKMVRKLPAVSSSNTTSDPQERDKRIKKNTHYKIGQTLEESAEDLQKELPLHYVLANCGDLEKSIAECTVDNELETETEVVRRLKLILDNEIQKISALKRNVSRTMQEYVSLKRNYEAAIRLDESMAKINNIKEQQEQCEVKLEKERDMWAAAMFELISREDEIVHCVRDYVINQRNYYEKSLHKINTSLARIHDIIQNTEKTRFDNSLTEHLSSTRRQISYILELCVCCLMENGLEEEGLLRVGCTKTKLRRMKHALEAQYIKTPLSAEYQDPHVIGSLLKDYLRVMPEPLLTYRYYNDFIRAADRNTEEERKSDIKATLQKLPAENFANLRYLTKFLWHVTQHADKNKMNSQNVAIVMSPNMLRTRPDKSSVTGDYMDQVNSSSAVNVIVELLISHWDYFFDGDVEFFITLQRHKLFADGGRYSSSKSNSSNENLDKHETDGPLDSPRYGTIRRQKPCAPSPPGKLIENKAQNHTYNANHNNNHHNHNNSKNDDDDALSGHIQISKPFAVVAPSTGIAMGVGMNTPDKNCQNMQRNGDIGPQQTNRAKELFPMTNGVKPEKPPLPKVLQVQQQQLLQQQQQQQNQQIQEAATPRPVPMTRTQFFGLDNLPSPVADRKSCDSMDNRNSMTFKPDLPQKPKIPKRPMVLGLSASTTNTNKIDDEDHQQQSNSKDNETNDDVKLKTEKLIEMLRQENCDNSASQTTATTTTSTTTNNISSNTDDNAPLLKETNNHVDKDSSKSNSTFYTSTNVPTINTESLKNDIEDKVETTTTITNTTTTTVTSNRQTPTTPVSPNMVSTPKRPTVPAPPPPTSNANRKPVVE